MRLLALALLLPALVAAGDPAAGAADADERRALWQENRRLAAEVELAAKPKSYFVVDLGRRTVELKVRGTPLAAVPIGDFGVWGLSPRARLRALEGKDALSRPEIRPGAEQTTENLDARILELSDMPAAYTVRLGGGFTLRVMPAAEGVAGRLASAFRLLSWRLSRPLATLRDRWTRRESTSVYIVVRPDDARRLYWSLYEGIEGIVVPP